MTEPEIPEGLIALERAWPATTRFLRPNLKFDAGAIRDQYGWPSYPAIFTDPV